MRLPAPGAKHAHSAHHGDHRAGRVALTELLLEQGYEVHRLIRRASTFNDEGEEHLNVGTGADVTIRELAELIARVVGWEGELEFDTSMPDGTPRKLLDVGALTGLGWTASIALEDGIRSTYEWFLDHAEPAGVG